MKLLIVIFLYFGFLSAYTQPRIQIEGNGVYDWGKINPKGKALSAKVKIYNKGNKILKISKVKPACGCTTAPLDKNEIEPGEFATLSISLNVNHDGIVSKSIAITSNDPKAENKNLILKANIIMPISLSNSMIGFSNLQIGKMVNTKILLKNNTNKDIKITKIVTFPDNLKIDLKAKTIIAGANELGLNISYLPKNNSDLRGKITLFTNNRDMEKVEISVWGRMSSQKK